MNDTNQPKQAQPLRSDCCDATCDFADETCYGEVDVIGEDYDEDTYWWVHACEKHRGDS